MAVLDFGGFPSILKSIIFKVSMGHRGYRVNESSDMCIRRENESKMLLKMVVILFDTIDIVT